MLNFNRDEIEAIRKLAMEQAAQARTDGRPGSLMARSQGNDDEDEPRLLPSIGAEEKPRFPSFPSTAAPARRSLETEDVQAVLARVGKENSNTRAGTTALKESDFPKEDEMPIALKIALEAVSGIRVCEVQRDTFLQQHSLPHPLTVQASDTIGQSARQKAIDAWKNTGIHGG